MGAPTASETEFKLEFWACCTIRLGRRRLHCVVVCCGIRVE